MLHFPPTPKCLQEGGAEISCLNLNENFIHYSGAIDFLWLREGLGHFLLLHQNGLSALSRVEGRAINLTAAQTKTAAS